MSTPINTTIRIRPEDLDELDRQAHARGMSRTAFLINSALKRLPDHQNAIEQRLEAVEQQVERHSKLLELTAGNY